VLNAIRAVSASRKIPYAALGAVALVESGGAAFTRFNGVDVPLIGIKGHYFDKLVPAPSAALPLLAQRHWQVRRCRGGAGGCRLDRPRDLRARPCRYRKQTTARHGRLARREEQQE